MSNPYKEPVGAAALALTLSLLIGGIAVFGFGSWPQIVMALVGLILIVLMGIHHDRVHRQRSERPHATWGLDDRNKPGGRRLQA